MPRIGAKVSTNIEDGIRAASTLKNELVDNADDAATILAQQWIREAQRTMQKNGSVVTGTGINSFRTTGGSSQGTKGVLGASYLWDLDTGTSAHYPDTNNYRFRAAAQQYNINRFELAESIARKGTRPHSWIRETTQRLNKTVNQRLQVQIDDAISKASQKI